MSRTNGRRLAAGLAGVALLAAACSDGVQDSVADAREKVEAAEKDPSNANVEQAEQAIVKADQKINDRYQQIVKNFNAKADAIEDQAGDDYTKLNNDLSELDGKVVAATGLVGTERTNAWKDVNERVEDLSSTATDMENKLDGDAKDAVSTLISDLSQLGKEIEAGLGLT